jgi:crotonobetainyl-CoA:carnitine CoA-transferase CaiB-like acyl-CoA transferase
VPIEYNTTIRGLQVDSRYPGRCNRPRIGESTSPEHSLPWQNLNAGKLSVTLNLRTQEAREVVFDLVRWADAVFDLFAPGAMKSWGFDYEHLRQINPQIVQASSSLMGQWGPIAGFAGFANLGRCAERLYEITGWPDRDPVGPFGAYTDTLAPRFGVLALLAALQHRQRTGEGQYIDLSQAESALHFFTQALLDFQVNGRLMSRIGNSDLYCAPHGVYRVAGHDRWIAIACETDAAELTGGLRDGTGFVSQCCCAFFSAQPLASPVANPNLRCWPWFPREPRQPLSR